MGVALKFCHNINFGTEKHNIIKSPPPPHATGPSGAPQRFGARALGSRIILLSWSPPLEGERNGEIQGYFVLIEEEESGTQYTHTVGQNSTAYLATMLHPYYNYNCSVAAFTLGGTGPFSDPVLVRTAEDSEWR